MTDNKPDVESTENVNVENDVKAAEPVETVQDAPAEGKKVSPFDEQSLPSGPVNAAAPSEPSSVEFHDVKDSVPVDETPVQTDNAERPEDGPQDGVENPDSPSEPLDPA